jgi:hypothetical protein
MRHDALLVAAVLRGTGQRRAARAVTALGIGAAAGAIGTGLAEPLPPAPGPADLMLDVRRV